MRLVFFSIGYIVFGSWMNLVINNYFQIVDLKINWVLIFTLVLAFRYSRIFLPFIGIIAGLICDAHSHGIMGLYGASFFLTLLMVNQIKKVFYSNTLFSISLAISALTFFESLTSLFILGLFETDLEQTSLIISTSLMLAIIHGFITPVIIKLIVWGEHIFLKEFS